MAYQTTGSSYPGQGAPATADELQSVVAPIALYPGALVAQILSAGTFSDQVADADYWLQKNKTLSGSALMAAVDKQNRDPSVKTLTPFPSVLNNMAKSLAWTSQLGEDYHNQQADVMTANHIRVLSGAIPAYLLLLRLFESAGDLRPTGGSKPNPCK